MNRRDDDPDDSLQSVISVGNMLLFGERKV